MFRLLVLTALCLTMAVPTIAHAQGRSQMDSDVAALMEGLGKKWTTARFAGIRTITYMEDGKVRKLEERVLRGNNKTRIEYDKNSSYAGQIVFEHGYQRKTYFKASNELRISSRSPLNHQLVLMRSGRGPTVTKISGSEKVAGHDCKLVVTVAEGDTVRHRMWVDEDKGVVLRRETYDPEGKVVAGYVYKRIQYNAKFSDKHLDPPTSAKVVTLEAEAARAAKDLGMPAFKMTQKDWVLTDVNKVDSRGVKLLALSYAHPTRRVTLSIVPKDTDLDNLDRIKPRGAETHLWTSGNYRLVLIGNLPLDELRRLARSVRT